MTPTTQQQQVLDQISTFMQSDASVFILRGYAGTGKTTLVKLIADYISQFRTLALMAPTGRAARVLSQKTGYPATTIHKAIYGKAALQTNEVEDMAETEFKLHFPVASAEGKVVAIIDEASMLCSSTTENEMFVFGTNNLMADLLTYVRPSFGGKVIFVGDPAQLPPVGEHTSQALNTDYFKAQGLTVMEAELTEVLRQGNDSTILKNALMLRNLLSAPQRNQLVFEEKAGEVESLPDGELLRHYLDHRRQPGSSESIVICYSNQSASHYNRDIRQALYAEPFPTLRSGDVLMVVQNNYQLGVMNGEFVQVLHVGSVQQQSAPVYVQRGAQRVREVITLEFVQVLVAGSDQQPQECLLQLDLLNNDRATSTIDEQRAMYINFCMRHSQLRPGTEAFAVALQEDPFFNCLKAKYGYAVTGHKCQGGEWETVFVDYSGRTGLDDDSLRWAYTATTRARQSLYVSHLPHITPFTSFRIQPVQQTSKMSEECRILGPVTASPFHPASAPDYLHAKCQCILRNMADTPYRVIRVTSNAFQELYDVLTPDGEERYILWYKKGGIFLKAQPQTTSAHNDAITALLDDEHLLPLQQLYQPSTAMHQRLHDLIQSACDSLGIQLTNTVEHDNGYSVYYYFRTSGTISYLKAYINKSGFVTYATPMSLAGAADHELSLLVEEIQRRFEQ